jgi:hypothetical protein
MTLRERLWLCLPPLAAACADATATFAGQDARYWAGDYAAVREFNPVARIVLQHHPAAFVLATALWCVLLAAVILAWRGRPAFVVLLGFGVTFCHAVAAAGWVARAGALGVGAAVLLLVAAERLVTLSWRRAGVGATSPALKHRGSPSP